MKIMKKIKLLSLFTVAIFATISCEEKGDFLTENKNVGGLITPQIKAITYVIGNGTSTEYKEVINVVQATNVQVTKINIYKRFNDSKGTAKPEDDQLSNEVLLRSIDVPSSVPLTDIPFSVTYLELIQGLSVGGVALPALDTALNIGDAFTLRYEQLRSDGKTVESSRSSDAVTKLAVGRRLAGKYKCIESAYYRIGVLTGSVASYPAEIIIESVDATNYKIVERFGFFGPMPSDANNIRFIVIGNNITYSPLQSTGNGQPFITCGSSPPNFNPEVNCGSSNKVILNNANKKDKLYMTFGYLSPSGPRVFYQVLEKIVE